MDALREMKLGPLTTGDLANIPDFCLGDTTISPSRRTMTGPGGVADVQPRVMQVLIVLAERVGHVVPREALFERCWGGVYVGDDSLNRVVGAVRKLGVEIAGGSFEIETIPKTGYRLTGASGQSVGIFHDRIVSHLTRRQLASAAVGIAALGSIGAYATFKSFDEWQFEQLLRQGDEALAGDDTLFKPDTALRSFEAAVHIHPDNARALGRLALAQSYFALFGPSKDFTVSIATAAQTAQRALAIDPREPMALLAIYELQGSTLDWWTRDQRLRQIIAIDPSNGGAMFDLSSLLLAAGMSRESWSWNERLLRKTPLSQNCLVKRALALWNFGRLPDTDNIMNQLRAQFPTSSWVWSIRFIIYALTDRPRAAQAMLENDPAMLRQGPETLMWRSCLDALDEDSELRVAKAREACLAAARASGELVGYALMALCALNDVDSAFEIANGYLLSRGPAIQRGKPAYARESSDAAHRLNTQWLFMPPCKNMRSDNRFLPLCEGIGLLEYWRKRRVQPDFIGR